MPHRINPKIKVDSYIADKWNFVAAWFLVGISLLILLQSGLTLIVEKDLVPGCLLLIVVLILLFLAFYVQRYGKRTIEVGPKGIASINRRGKKTFISWDEIADFSDKTTLKNISFFVFDRSGKKKIVIAGFKDFPFVAHRVISELVKRMKSPKLPLTFYSFPAEYLVLTPQGLQFRNFFKIENFNWDEIEGLDIGTRFALLRQVPFLKITIKNGRILRFQGKKALQIYLILLKTLRQSKNFHPRLLDQQPIPLVRGCFAAGLFGIWWISIHGLFKFIPNGLSTPGFWSSLTALILMLYLIIKTSVYERLLPQTTFRIFNRQFFIFLPLYFFSLFLGSYLSWLVWMQIGRADLRKAQNDLTAAGYSLDMPKNAAVVPEKDNAATYLVQAANAASVGPLEYNNPLYKKTFYQNKNETDFLTDFQIHAREGSLSPGELVYAGRLLQEHTDILQLIDTAYEKQKIDWGMDFTIQPSYKISIPKTGPMMNFAKLLLCRAVLQARENHSQEAFKSIKTGLFMGEAEAQKHFFINISINQGVYLVMLSAIRAIDPFVNPGQEEKELLPLLNTQKLREEFLNGVQMDCLGTKSGWYWTSNDPFLKPFSFMDTASYYEAQLQKLNSFKLPYLDAKKAWEKTEEKYRLNGWMIGLIYDNTIFPGEYYRLLQTVAYCRLAHAAMEARLFHQKYKRWPDAVWELDRKSEDDYLDPFTDGNILKIMRYHDGVLIYSVGGNAQDNQGMPWNPKYSSYFYNLNWVVEK